MIDASDRFLSEWHRIVAARDVASLPRVLAEDVALAAPPYWEPLRGRVVVVHLLGLILETIEGFTYHREWKSENEYALEFTGTVSGLNLQGIDLISLNDAAVVRRIDVLIRPANAVDALRSVITPRIGAFLAELNSKGGT
jgi:hypothetical protein